MAALRVYKVLPGQSLLDCALCCYGSLEAVFDLLKRNNLSITDTLAPGSELSYDPAAAGADPERLASLTALGFSPATRP